MPHPEDSRDMARTHDDAVPPAAALAGPTDDPTDDLGVLDALTAALDQRRVVQDFRPIADSLSWHAAAQQWRDAGLDLFLEDQVPFTVNNDGTLSRQVATLLFEACLADDPGGPIEVLEVGAGIGLHARYLLDAFVGLSRAAGRDFHERLRFTVTDGALASVQRWAAAGLFEEHAARVRLAVCDAADLRQATGLDGRRIALPRFRAILFNYMLDVLPAGLYRQGLLGWEELHLRVLDRGAATPAAEVGEVEARFLPVEGTPPFLRHAAADADGRPVLVNGGALDCLDQALTRLDPSGFILVNDYGVAEGQADAPRGGPDRFGPTLAWGLNFPLIERHLTAGGARVSRPDAEANAAIYSRLITARSLPATEAAFRSAFDETAQQRAAAPLEAARRHLHAGAMGLALRAYRDAIAARPHDWRLMGEAAEALIGDGRLHEALRLSEAALRINPWFSPSLWNPAGDALFHLGRFEEAEARYREAIRISPRDMRGHFNLAFTRAEAGDVEAALAALAAALAADRQGALRERILAKQQEVLALQSAAWLRLQAAHQRQLHAVACPIP
jgi:tetratricopeptide (TPR) repeat protein